MQAQTQVKILGVRIDAVTMAEALARCTSFIADGKPHYVVTPNAEIVMQAERNSALAEALAGADLAVADGMGVVWASRLLGKPLPERVAGFDLSLGLLQLAAQAGYRVYLLGARPEVVQGAAEVLRRRYQGLKLVGVQDGFFGANEETEVIAAIRTARPHILLVAMGVPKQELWLARWKQELGVPLSIGVGGTFDVLAGKVKRAPRWLSQLGLEWAWRLLLQPARWRRALLLPVFISRVIGAWLRNL